MNKAEYDQFVEIAQQLRIDLGMRFKPQGLKKLFDWFDAHNGDLSALKWKDSQ